MELIYREATKDPYSFMVLDKQLSTSLFFTKNALTIFGLKLLYAVNMRLV